MTTAFTAIPIKMTMSAIRFLGVARLLDVDMAATYSARGAPFIDLDQRRRIFCGVDG
jgi:hypothetical protein